jgi:hypothetical protein
MPREKRLLSYVGRLTMARISPVCGFIAITTPRFMPIFFIAQLSAFSASFWAWVSIVSVERVARLRLADGLQDLGPAARRVALDALGP